MTKKDFISKINEVLKEAHANEVLEVAKKLIPSVDGIEDLVDYESDYDEGEEPVTYINGVLSGFDEGNDYYEKSDFFSSDSDATREFAYIGGELLPINEKGFGQEYFNLGYSGLGGYWYYKGSDLRYEILGDHNDAIRKLKEISGKKVKSKYAIGGGVGDSYNIKNIKIGDRIKDKYNNEAEVWYNDGEKIEAQYISGASYVYRQKDFDNGEVRFLWGNRNIMKTGGKTKKNNIKGKKISLEEIYKALKNSPNFKKVELRDSKYSSTGKEIYILSKLVASPENDLNEGAIDEFIIAYFDEELTIIYLPNGYDQEVKTIDEIIDFTRANEVVDTIKEPRVFYSVELGSSEDQDYEFDSKSEAFSFARKKEREGYTVTDVAKYVENFDTRSYNRKADLLDAFNTYSFNLRLSSGNTGRSSGGNWNISPNRFRWGKGGGVDEVFYIYLTSAEDDEEHLVYALYDKNNKIIKSNFEDVKSAKNWAKEKGYNAIQYADGGWVDTFVYTIGGL
jgi:hypothetical protein